MAELDPEVRFGSERTVWDRRLPKATRQLSFDPHTRNFSALEFPRSKWQGEDPGNPVKIGLEEIGDFVIAMRDTMDNMSGRADLVTYKEAWDTYSTARKRFGEMVADEVKAVEGRLEVLDRIGQRLPLIGLRFDPSNSARIVAR